MAMQRCRIAVWGLGRHAINNILPAIAARSDFRLAGVCSRNKVVGENVAQRFQCRYWHTAEAMLETPEVDFVYICTPVAVHAEQALKALESGKHVICEKSLVCVPSDARLLVGLAKDRGLVLCEALMFLHHPRTREVLDFLKRNMPRGVRLMSTEFLLPRLDVPGYRMSKELGGGAYWDVACYPVALITAIEPAAGLVSYAAFETDPKTGVDCAGSARLTWPSGASAQMNWGYGFAYRNHATITGISHGLEIGRVFTKGGDALDFAIYDSQGRLQERRTSPLANSFACLLNDVLGAVDDTVAREALYARALAQAEAMAEIRKSALGSASENRNKSK